MEKGACLAMKNIGKPCTGKRYARFDEGALRKGRTQEHVVAACGEALIKEPKNPLNQCSTLPITFVGVPITFVPIIFNFNSLLDSSTCHLKSYSHTLIVF